MPTKEPIKKTPSHFKAGILAGTVFGIAAGIFMSSKQGKKLAKQLQSQTKEIQARLQKELKKTKKLTEESYADAIENVLGYYAKSRKIASKEVPELRRYLMAKWSTVKKELNAPPSKKR
jgi:gas vesicle protein